MHTVFKYPLKQARNVISTHVGAEILTATFQKSAFGRGIMLYAKLNPDARTEERLFQVVATGSPIAPEAIYTSTVEDPDGFMLHIFEIPIK